jgi:phospholipid N-methyltransferase
MEEKIKNIIDNYYSKKKDKKNDYVLLLDEEVELNVIDLKSDLIIKNKQTEVNTGYDILSEPYKTLKKENIELLNPDVIDNKFFWECLVKKFPLFSISQYPRCKNEDDVNKANLNASIFSGFFQKIHSKINATNTKVLEIGPGYGSFFYEITKKYQNCNYLAIDINPLFYYEGLYVCDGKSIPDELGENFDLIFAFNSFRHMSKKQRTSYYKEAYKKLKKGGTFLFTNYLISEQNKFRNDFWSFQDSDGIVYNSFFSQLIPVDIYDDLADELNKIGFSIKVKLSQNYAIIECIKI